MVGSIDSSLAGTSAVGTSPLLASTHPVELSALVMKDAIGRAGIDKATIEDATLRGATAQLAVKFQSKLITATRDKIARQVPRWLTASDVADAILWIATRPAHVVVSELVLMPSGQGR